MVKLLSAVIFIIRCDLTRDKSDGEIVMGDFIMIIIGPGYGVGVGVGVSCWPAVLVARASVESLASWDDDGRIWTVSRW